jgi:hypothetical protein
MGGFKRLEAQDRGAAHYHCLLWGLGDKYNEILDWVVSTWYELAGQGDLNHYKFHMGLLPKSEKCVTRVESWRQVMAYVAKYMSKVDEKNSDWDYPGRFWSTKYPDCIPWAKVEYIPVTFGQAVKVMRLLRRSIHAKSRNYHSLVGFVNNPGFWLQRLPQMIN